VTVFTALVLLVAAGVPEPLLAPGLVAAFQGKTITGAYADGVEFSETYYADGHLTYSDVRGPATGQWFVRNDLFCTFYENMQGGCFRVERLGANCFDFFYASSLPDGATGETAHYTARGAATDARSTCPDLLQS
jgi:hypothetical protein